jgi:hypothetical protein
VNRAIARSCSGAGKRTKKQCHWTPRLAERPFQRLRNAEPVHMDFTFPITALPGTGTCRLNNFPHFQPKQ